MLSRRSILAGLAATTAGTLAGRASAASGWAVPPEFEPRLVEIDTYHDAGEIHVDPNFFALYLMLPGYKAWRYTVAVSLPELWEPGEYHVKWIAEWPRWRPTNAMIRRSPEQYAQYRNGMPGGPNNPMGARALYLFDGDRDTYLRIHGTTKPWTIGTATSNGCARMVNDHVIHLADRAKRGARVILHPRWDGQSV